MLVTSFWSLNELSSQIERQWGLQNFQTLWQTPVYRTIALRTVGMAAAVTVTDLILAFPLAYYAARMATPADADDPAARGRHAAVVELPRPGLRVEDHHGRATGRSSALLGVLGHPSQHLGEQLGGLDHVQLPVAAVRHPADLRGARAPALVPARGVERPRRASVADVPAGRASRSSFPGIVAASIFTFSLTLGDYITPTLVGKAFFIGNVIYNLVGVGEQPAVRGRVRDGAGRHHGHLPVARAAARRVRGAVGGRMESRLARFLIKVRDRSSRCSSCTCRS